MPYVSRRTRVKANSILKLNKPKDKKVRTILKKNRKINLATLFSVSFKLQKKKAKAIGVAKPVRSFQRLCPASHDTTSLYATRGTDQERRSRHAQVQERGRTSMYQISNVIKAAAAAARTNVTREIRLELKATDRAARTSKAPP